MTMRLCDLCSAEYEIPFNYPTWPKCMACTLNPRRQSRGSGLVPAYPLPPTTADRVTFIVPGRPLSFNRVFAGHNFRHTKEAREYKLNVRSHAYNALGAFKHTWDKSRRFTISLTAYFATDQSDSDNIIKPVKDALQNVKEKGYTIPNSGVLYFNDSQVISDHTEKQIDKEAPRLIVTVEAVAQSIHTAPQDNSIALHKTGSVDD